MKLWGWHFQGTICSQNWELWSGVDAAHALVDGPGEGDPVPGPHVRLRVLLAWELLVAEQALELGVGEAHHPAHPGPAPLPGTRWIFW